MPATPKPIKWAMQVTTSPLKPIWQLRQLTSSLLKLCCKQNPATSKWTKMISILDKMRDFKWRIKELVYVYLIEPLEGIKYASVKMRRERFMKALLEEEEVLKIIWDEILKDEVLKQLGLVHINQLYQELETLQKKSIHFGAYNNEASLQAFDINNAVVELEAHAPSLFETLGKLMEDC